MESNLQVIKNSYLPVSENQIIKSALACTSVKMAIPYEIDSAVSVAIDKAIFYLGLKTIMEDRDMIKVTVIDDVKRHFANLTISEVGIAIESGSKGRYGKVVGLAPKDVYDWLTAYSISQERKDQVMALAKQDKATPEPTEEQKRALRWTNLLNAWATFKSKGAFNDHGNAVYNTLVSSGKINYTDEQMSDFIRLAKADLMKEYNPLQHVGNFVKMSEFKAIISDITSGGDKNTRVIVTSKKIALNHFFSELAGMEMEITDLFEAN